jgi:hypothetical protein
MSEGFEPTAEQEAAFIATATHFTRNKATKEALALGLEDGTFVVKLRESKIDQERRFGWYVIDAEPAAVEPVQQVQRVAQDLKDAAAVVAVVEEDDDASYQAELDARLLAKHGGPAVAAAETLTPAAPVEAAHEAVALVDEISADDTVVPDVPSIDGSDVLDDGEEPTPDWVEVFPSDHHEPLAEPVAPAIVVAEPAPAPAPLPAPVQPSPLAGVAVAQIGYSDTPDKIRELADKVSIRHGRKIILRDARTFQARESVEWVKQVEILTETSA